MEPPKKGAVSLGRGIRTRILDFTQNLAPESFAEKEKNDLSAPSKRITYAEAAKTSASVPKAQPTTLYRPPSPKKLTHIFLPPREHPARQASPYATLDILRKHLDVAAKEIQQFWPKNGINLHIPTQRKAALKGISQGAQG